MSDPIYCPECNGRVFIQATGTWVKRRETTGLVCQQCGWDYGRDGEPGDASQQAARDLAAIDQEET